MKNFLFVTLLSAVAFSGIVVPRWEPTTTYETKRVAVADTIGWQKTQIFVKGKLIRNWARRNLTSYPKTTTGNKSFYAAMDAGQLTVTLTDPKTAPSGTGIRYSLTNGELYVQGYGDLKQWKIERADGIGLTGANKDGVALQSGTFFGYGGDADPPYDKQWKGSFLPSLAGQTINMTFQQTSGNLFTTTLIVPKSGYANKVLLAGGTTNTVNPPTSVTTTPPTSTTTANIERILFVGNSILHNTWEGKSWGMAASAPNKDWFHLVSAKFKALNPNADCREIGDARFKLDYGIVEGSHWEEFYWRLDDTSLDIVRGGLSRYQPLADFKSQYLFVELGDNITDNSHNLKTNFQAFVDKMISGYTACKVIVLTPLITNNGTRDILMAAANERGWAIADNSTLTRSLDSQYGHPDDAYMQRIADLAWSKVSISTTVTPPTTTTTTATPTALTFNIVSYNCTNGILQWKFTSPSTTPVTVDWNGVKSGAVNPGEVQLTSLPSDRWVNADYSGKASQSGQPSIDYKFTTSCSLGPTTTPTTTPPTTTTTTPPATTAIAGLTYNYPVLTSVASWTANSPSYGEVVRLENQYLRVESRKTYGGAIQITDKTTGKDLVNWTDWGRQNELSLYSGPKDFSKDGFWQFNGIGWNPLTAGDASHNPGKVIAMGWVTGNDNKPRLYTKTQMINWPTNGIYVEAWNERWIALTGKEVDVIARVTFNRSDQTFYYPETYQEYPCFMRSGKYNVVKFYNGPAPYTGGAITQTYALETDTQTFQAGKALISEPWVAMERDNVAIFMNTDKLGLVGLKVDNADWGDNGNPQEGDSQDTYATAQNRITIDPQGVLYHHYGFYVTSSATFQEGRDWANARPRKYGDLPDFKFDAAHGRNDWNVDKGYDQREPFSSDGWNVTLIPTADGGAPTARRSSLTSPFGSWKASSIPKLYVRMKYSGQENQFKVTFWRNGQLDSPIPSSFTNQLAKLIPNGFNLGSQNYTFTPIKDGQYHTYEINTGTNSAWQGAIQYFQINYGDGNNPIPQENLQLLYFGANNPGQ